MFGTTLRLAFTAVALSFAGGACLVLPAAAGPAAITNPLAASASAPSGVAGTNAAIRVAAAAASVTPGKPGAALNADQLRKLVAPIALYPDDLVSLVISAAIFPLQIVEADRFLEQKKTKPDLKPNDQWDGSIIALLNYPTVVKMMSEDLSWTAQLGSAVSSQQHDLLAAIQVLRADADNKGLLKSNDNVIVDNEDNKIVIASANPEVLYIPEYPPQMFYEPVYWPAALYYVAYPSYYYPWAPYWPWLITGVFWASWIDWNRGDCWGGHIDVDIDWGRGRFNWGQRPHVDPRTIDRSKLDRTKFDMRHANFDHSKMNQELRRNPSNNIAERGKERADAGGGRNLKGDDVRSSVATGLGAGAAAGTLSNADNRGRAGDLATAKPDGTRDRPGERSGGKPDSGPGTKAGAKAANGGRSSAYSKPAAGNNRGNVNRVGPTRSFGQAGGAPGVGAANGPRRVGARPSGGPSAPGRGFGGGGGAGHRR